MSCNARARGASPRAALRLARVACGVFLCAAGPSCAAEKSVQATRPEQVEQLIQEKRFDEAIELARALLEQGPQDPDRHMALAQALAAKGRRVEPVVEAQVVMGPEGHAVTPSPAGARTEVVYERALFEEALQHVRRAIEVAPKRADLRWSECYLLTDAGEIERAAAALRRALAELPREAISPRTVASYGSERLRRGDTQGGAILLGVVAEAFPGNATVQVEYAWALLRDGKGAEALEALDRAGELAGGDVRLQRKRGLLYLVLGEHGRARSAFERAFQTSHEDADRFAAAAAAFGEDPEKARWLFEELATPAASADPRMVQHAEAFLGALEGDTATRLALVERLRRLGQDLLALPVLDRILAAEPDRERAKALAREIRARFLPAEN